VNTESALLAAIVATPDDDLPRLVYADWLDEHDQPERAEFIRVQCEAARIECEAARTNRASPAHTKLIERSSRLLRAHAADWFGPLTDERVGSHIITRRGFVDRLVLTTERFTDHADIIFAHAPLLRGLHIRSGCRWQAFYATLRGSTTRSLSFGDGVFTVEAAGALAASDCGRALVELELENQPLGPDGMAALASAALWNLEKLSVPNCGIGDEGAWELFSGEPFENLRDLDLSENGLTADACRALAQASDLSQLEQLALCDNRITADGVAALATAPHLGRLRRLNLYSNPIGPEGGRAILASRHWGGLEHLSLTNCGVGVAVVEDLRWVYGQKAVTA